MDGWKTGVIECDNTANIQQFVDVEKIYKGMVKGVPSINEGEIYPRSFCNNIW